MSSSPRLSFASSTVSTVTTIALLGLSLSACSAVVQPDPDRLGATPDGGPSEIDAHFVVPDGGPVTPTDGGPVTPVDGGPVAPADGGPVTPTDGGPVTPIDGGSGCPSSCDDGVACTDDRCVDGRCVHLPDDSRCSDPCFVGGRCTAHGCEGGAPVDADRDGYPAMQVGGVMCSGGTDCDDAAANVHPGMAEICGNGIDDDCDATTTDVCAATPGDSCANPIDFPFASGSSGSSTGTVEVPLPRMQDDYTTSCQTASGGRDAVYTFLLTSTSDVTIETTGSVDTVIAAAFDCDEGAFRNRCNDDKNYPDVLTSRIWLHNVQASGFSPVRVYVLVDTYNASSATGAPTLSITVRSPAPDSCGGGSNRPLDISGGGTLLGHAGPGTSTYRGSCMPSTDFNTEAVARLEESDQSLERLTLTGVGYTPSLYVRQGSCSGSGSTEVGCRVGSGSSVTLSGVGNPSARSSSFHVFMDGVPNLGGDYRLDFNP